MAIQVTSEERLRFKKRARQRLLGAVVLLISAAIALPLLLDQAPRLVGADVVINMPEPAAANSKPEPVAPTAIARPVEAGVTPVNTALPLAAPIAPVHASKPAYGGVVAEQTQLPADDKASPTPHHAVPLAAKKPAAQIIHKDDSQIHYVVQLGAFSSMDNVRQLRQQLAQAGVVTYVENLPSGAIRVRAGPFVNRSQADKILAKIAMAGVQAQIVPLAH